jgi:hypothetical protein
MKTRFNLNWKAIIILAGLPFVAAWLQGEPSDQGDLGVPSAVSVSTDNSAVPIDTSTAAKPALATAPADLNLYPGTAEVAKMAQAGVGDDVILSYITNSSVRFGVNADQIVYLNDLGVSGSVVTAMMQHDASLNTTTPPAVTPPPVTSLPDATAPGTDDTYPPTQVAGDNLDMTPPPDYGDYSQYPGDYSVPDDTDYFYDSLLPYGNWIYLTGYGMCWQPTVYLRDHSWRPYFDRGRWLYSDSGWYWQSDYTWGWAAFHYGRWFMDGSHGWVWHPDRVWGPSWVAWRQSGEYAGWAPLPPAAVFRPGIGFSFHHQAVTATFGFGLPGGLYAFIPIERFADYAPSRYVISGTQAGRLFSESTALAGVAASNGHIHNQGMSPQLVDARAGEHIRRVVIQTTPGTDANGHVVPDRLAKRGDSLVIYRPQLSTIPGHPPLGFQNTGTANSHPGVASTEPPHPSTVIRQGMPSATQSIGGNTASHMQVYQVTHEQPRQVENSTTTANAYPPNSMVLIGRQNMTQPSWTSRQIPSSTGTPAYTYTYHPGAGSVQTYAVSPDSSSYRPSEPVQTRASYSYGNGYNMTAGSQEYYGYQAANNGNQYYRSEPANEAPGSRASYGTTDNHQYRQPAYAPSAGQESYYRGSATGSRETYSEPGRSTYSAPARESYSAPSHESYSAPSRESYSAPAASSSSHGSSSSGGGGGGSSSQNSRGH